jgi:hypothetical protein
VRKKKVRHFEYMHMDIILQCVNGFTICSCNKNTHILRAVTRRLNHSDSIFEIIIVNFLKEGLYFANIINQNLAQIKVTITFNKRDTKQYSANEIEKYLLILFLCS